jgi:hypothetical protein
MVLQLIWCVGGLLCMLCRYVLTKQCNAASCIVLALYNQVDTSNALVKHQLLLKLLMSALTSVCIW